MPPLAKVRERLDGCDFPEQGSQRSILPELHVLGVTRDLEF